MNQAEEKATGYNFPSGILAYSSMGRPLGVTEKLAVSILLVAVAKADHELHPKEEETIKESLSYAMNLSQHELDDCLASSEALSEEKNTIRHAAWIVNEDLSPRQRKVIMQILGMVTQADGKVVAGEKALAEKIRSLVEVPAS